jgi:hypothetical protein
LLVPVGQGNSAQIPVSGSVGKSSIMIVPSPKIPDPPARVGPGMAAGSRPADPSPIVRVVPRPGGSAAAAVDGRTGPITGRSPTAALQDSAVDSALEQLGALSSLLGPDGPISSLDGIKGRRSVH